MVNDPISDMIIRIKNAYLARLTTVALPYSNVKRNLGKILVEQQFIKEVKEKNEGVTKELILTLRYENKQPAVSDVKIISKPSLRVYVSKTNIPKVLGGLGIAILSTSKGMMTGKEANKKGLGGELLLKIW